MPNDLLYRNKIIGHLPTGWVKVKVDNNLVDILGGFSCGRRFAVPSGIPHLRPMNITANGELVVNDDTVYIPPDFKEDIENYSLQKWDILYNNTNSVELVGKTAIVREPLAAAFSNHINRLRVRNPELIDPRWLALALRSLQAQGFFAANCNKWIGQAGFSVSELAEVEIPLPDIRIQRRIVARIEALLSEVREMRELNTQILTNTSTLRRSVVLNLFQDLESSQKDGWRRIKIDNDSVNIKSGFAFARRNMVPQGVPHLRPFNIDTKGEVIITDDTVTIPLDFRDDLDEFRLLPGDVLYNNTNSVELVGKSGIVRKPMAVAFSNHLNRIRVRDPETLDPRWLVLALRNLFETGFFAANCVKWIGQAGFSITRLAEVEILLPDFNTQQKAIAQIENAQSEIDEMEFYNKENSQLIADMEQAFLAQAFRGEL